MAGTYNAPYNKTSWRAMVLSQTQMQENAVYIYDYMHNKYNWTLNAVAGMLGNLESESTMNPARPQNNAVNNESGDVQTYDSWEQFEADLPFDV